MYKVVKSTGGTMRKVNDHTHVFNLITKEMSPHISITRLEAADYFSKRIANTDIIYYVLGGVLEVTFQKTTVMCEDGDACFITKGETYILNGTFQVLSICSPAYGNENEK